MPWSKEKLRQYRSYGDGRDKKRASDKAYQQKNRDRIREAAYARPIAPDAPKNFICTGCKVEKPFTPEFFTYRPAMKWKLTYRCRACQNRDSLLHQTMSKYGMTIEEARKFRDAECCICGSRSRVHIDHCHSTGKLRGALCSKCNVGLGNFDDDVDRMKAAISYVEKHRG